MDMMIKTEWIRRLRSGDYVQGTGALCGLYDDEREYCCLGVLCDIAREQGVVEERPFITRIEYCANDGKLPEAVVLPLAVWRWAGLRRANPLIRVDDDKMTLSNLNDGTFHDRSYTFDQIADVIEEQL